MFSLLKFLTAAAIATFGIWYVFQHDSITEVTGGVAFVCVISSLHAAEMGPIVHQEGLHRPLQEPQVAAATVETVVFGLELKAAR